MSSIIIEIEKIVQGGYGLGRRDGKVFFVPYVLPGEVVHVEQTIPQKDFEVVVRFHHITTAEQRIDSLCSYFPRCGGCQFHYMPYEVEQKVKTNIFLETLNRQAGIREAPLTFIPGNPSHYRNRVRFHRDNENIGFLESRGTALVPIQKCMVCVEEVNRFLLDFHADKLDIGYSKEIAVFGYKGRYYTEGSNEEITIELLNHPIVFSPNFFFQSNLTLLERMISDCIKPIQGNKILELYGGVGTFGVFLKDQCGKFFMVEGNTASVEYARRNLGKGNFEVISRSVEDWISPNSTFDTIVLDPPRTGLSKSVRNSLLQMKPEQILYISCNPVTFARDLKAFIERGYRIDFCTLYDFYPRTPHVEVVCKLLSN